MKKKGSFKIYILNFFKKKVLVFFQKISKSVPFALIKKLFIGLVSLPPVLVVFLVTYNSYQLFIFISPLVKLFFLKHFPCSQELYLLVLKAAEEISQSEKEAISSELSNCPKINTVLFSKIGIFLLVTILFSFLISKIYTFYKNQKLKNSK